MKTHKLPWRMPHLARAAIKNAFLVLMASTILAAGAYTDLIFKALDVAIVELVQALGLTDSYQAVVKNSHAKLTLQSLPSMLVYGLGYCSLCLLILYVYLGKRQQFLLVLVFYAGVFALCLGLIVLAKALGNCVPVYNLARRLIEMVVSPLPVILLVSVFSFAKSGSKGQRT
jgi:hypothetical protein